MKAPVKLYVDSHDNLNDSFLYGFTERHLSEDIEYTRTDAFIEKAADYIANNMQCNGYTLQTKVKLIRDFKKYMED